MPDFEIILVSIVIIFILVSLYFEIIRAGFTFLIGVAILTVFNILTPQEMLSGVANEQVAVIMLLLLIGNIIKETGILDVFFDRIFRSTKTYKGFMARIMILIAPLSAFLNNTPLVAILMPYAHNWAKKRKVPISKLLMPLSFTAILGGCATLIGTSTNLIVNGLVVEQTIIPNLPELQIFDFAAVGVPMIIIGFLYMFFFGQKLLPTKMGIDDEFETNTRKYVIEAQIRKNSGLEGKTITEAKLRNLQDLYLSQIIRKGSILSAVPYDTVLKEGDILLFAGNTDAIVNLIKENPALEVPNTEIFTRKKNLDLIEIVISENSKICHKTLKTENFRAKYEATAIAVHRNGEKISGKLGAVRLRAGDALILLAGKHFKELSVNTKDFFIISKPTEIRKIGIFKIIVLIGGTILSILLAALGVVKLFIALVLFMSLLLILKITTPKKLAKGIDYDLGFIIAMSLALGLAMMKTGFAEIISNIISQVFMPLGLVGMLGGIYVITALFAAFITNKAAVAIILPISLAMSKYLDYPTMPFILVVAFAAAANFMTPIGYQTNTMVYGPGGYKFRDFLKVGTPLTIIYGIVTVTILRLFYF